MRWWRSSQLYRVLSTIVATACCKSAFLQQQCCRRASFSPSTTSCKRASRANSPSMLLLWLSKCSFSSLSLLITGSKSWMETSKVSVGDIYEDVLRESTRCCWLPMGELTSDVFTFYVRFVFMNILGSVFMPLRVGQQVIYNKCIIGPRQLAHLDAAVVVGQSIQFSVTSYYFITSLSRTMIGQTELPEFEHVVCGGGLVGAVWALYLRRKSNSVALFQSYFDLRQQLIPGGRSINLVLAKKALDALQQLGITEEVLKNTIPIKGQTIHRSSAQNYKLLYGVSQNQTTYCIARNKLSQCLLDIVQNNNIPIFFEHVLVSGDLDRNQYIFNVKSSEGNCEVKVKAKFMYGTDGAGSRVRELILEKTAQQTNIQWYPADYKQFFLPACENGYPLDPNWVHLWPRGGHMMMGHANANSSFSLTLILPSKGPISFEQLDSEQKIESYFGKYFPQLSHSIPNLCLQFTENPVGYLGTIRCPAWHYRDKVVLLGDAAHTICPFLWQAVNVGFDDCFQLDKIISEYGFGEKAFQQYFKTQKPKADALAEITLDNFDTLASFGQQDNFIELKTLQKLVECQSPDLYWSKYRMIFFGDLPYNQILAAIKRWQKRLQEWKQKLRDPEGRRLFVMHPQVIKHNS